MIRPGCFIPVATGQVKLPDPETFVQYNSSADLIVTNLRMNVIHAPLSDLFLVFTEHRDMENRVVLDRLITVKLTKMFGF